jgi:hypothetical protein
VVDGGSDGGSDGGCDMNGVARWLFSVARWPPFCRTLWIGRATPFVSFVRASSSVSHVVDKSNSGGTSQTGRRPGAAALTHLSRPPLTSLSIYRSIVRADFFARADRYSRPGHPWRVSSLASCAMSMSVHHSGPGRSGRAHAISSASRHPMLVSVRSFRIAFSSSYETRVLPCRALPSPAEPCRVLPHRACRASSSHTRTRLAPPSRSVPAVPHPALPRLSRPCQALPAAPGRCTPCRALPLPACLA